MGTSFGMAAVEPTISTGEHHIVSLCMDQASIPTHEVTALSDIPKHLRVNLVDSIDAQQSHI